MREDSHLDDMRSAIRGDFERLAERRGGQELMREPEPEPVSEPESEPEREPVPDPEPGREVEHEADPEPSAGSDAGSAEQVVAAESDPAAELAENPADEPTAVPRRSFLDRLLGR